KLSHGFSSCSPAAWRCATALLTEAPQQSERGQCLDRKRAAKPLLMDSGVMRTIHPERHTASVCHRRWHALTRQLICLGVRTPRRVRRHSYAAYVGIARRSCRGVLELKVA